MGLVLEVVEPGAAVATVPVDKDTLLIGRSGRCANAYLHVAQVHAVACCQGLFLDFDFSDVDAVGRAEIADDVAVAVQGDAGVDA